MKKSIILSNLIVIAGISVSAPAFSDTIHGALMPAEYGNVLELLRVELDAPTNPVTINDYVKRQRENAASNINEGKTHIAMETADWQKILGQPPRL
jgi:hypothetical protein